MVISSRTFHILKSNYRVLLLFVIDVAIYPPTVLVNVTLCSSHRFHTQEIRACVSITLGVHVSLSNHLTFKGITDATAVLLLDFASSFVFNLSFLQDSARTLGNLTLSLSLSPTTFLFNTSRQDVLMSH